MTMDNHVTVHETHSGIVLLIGDRAYKIKKPLDLGFLNFATVQARALACRRELDLNRRLAPDVYLDVATMTSSDGQPCEYVLIMRRMPEDRRLSTMVRRGDDVADQLRSIARIMAQFHSSAERSPVISANLNAAPLRERWRGNFDAARSFRGTTLPATMYDEIERLALTYVDGRHVLFQERDKAGYGVDGHGDLLADDIFCLPDHPRILDCLDFDAKLRWLDVNDDVAFLAMDLERLGHADLAALFLAWYAEFSGNHAPPSLQHHYIAYRAFVRAAVSCIRAAQGAPEYTETALVCAQLALSHLKQSEVRLIVVGGSPGTGKTTIARALAEHLDYVLLSSDAIRKEGAAVAADICYNAEAKHATYRALLDRAEQALVRGQSVIADATWSEEQTRTAVAELAKKTSSRLTVLECRVSAAVSADRAQRRHESGTDLSDADATVARSLAAQWQEWPTAIGIDTSASIEQSVHDALVALGA